MIQANQHDEQDSQRPEDAGVRIFLWFLDVYCLCFKIDSTYLIAWFIATELLKLLMQAIVIPTESKLSLESKVRETDISF
jgi:hypothetical protein